MRGNGKQIHQGPGLLTHARSTRYNDSAGVERSRNQPAELRRRHDRYLGTEAYRLEHGLARSRRPVPAQVVRRQVIEHGKAEDVANLDLGEVARLLDELNLPPYLHSLWSRFLEPHHVAR